MSKSKYMNSEKIDNAVICFKVEKSWILDKNIYPDSIILNSYSDKKWEALTGSLFNEDDKFLYFTAKPPGSLSLQ